MTENQEVQFEEMYHELYPKMVNFAGRLCRDKDDAHDIAQEAFIKAYSSYDKIDDTRRADNWIMKIVYNTFLDLRRKRSRRIVEISENCEVNGITLEDRADKADSPEDKLMKKSVDPILMRALRKLDPVSRDIIQLIYFDQRDQVEVGRMFGLNEGALRSKIHRVMGKLRNEFAGNRYLGA